MTPRAAKTIKTSAPRRRGSILIVALVVLFALAAMTLAMAHAARVDAAVSANVAAGIEAAAVARGAEQFVIELVTTEQDAALSRPEDDFVARPLGGGWFWIVRPDLDDDSLPQYGLVDESTKIDLNRAPEETLRELPGVTDEIVGSILDWRDDDDEVRAYGAESAYYRSLPEPYNVKNDRFEHIEELLLVRGVTPEWLYGVGAAHSAAYPSGETSGSVFDDSAAENGVCDRVTVYPDPSYAADIVAVSGNGRAFRRVKMVVNLRGDQPRILYHRDITSRGWPLDPAILVALRRGEGLNVSGTRMSPSLGSTR